MYRDRPLVFLLALILGGCALGTVEATMLCHQRLDSKASPVKQRQVCFVSQGVALAGELDLPVGDPASRRGDGPCRRRGDTRRGPRRRPT